MSTPIVTPGRIDAQHRKPMANAGVPSESSNEQTGDCLLQLLSRCSRGDRAAFMRLYKATSTKLYLTALGILKSEHWAEDALQEAYLKIWRHAHSYNASKSKPMTWMINVLRNQALDMLRKSQYRAEYENSETTAVTVIEQDVSCVTEVRDGLSDLVTCMQHVREEQCRYILLVHHQGLTPTEIARREGRPVGTVKTWVRRGIDQIREQMRVSCAAA